MPASAVAKLPYRVKDILGQTFGRLTVIAFSHSKKYKGGASAVWKCLCQCGKTTFVLGSNLRSGTTSSCKCANRDKITKHGHSVGGKDGKSASSLYRSWSSMKYRCENRRCHNYSNYGGRNISVCERWRNSFVNFAADVGEKPGPEYSLDRIDNDGNYEPGNVRWATPSQQRRNTRSRTLTDEEIAKAIELRRQGKTNKAIGELFDVGPSAISLAIKREADKNA